jgi:hypothetical protein
MYGQEACTFKLLNKRSYYIKEISQKQIAQVNGGWGLFGAGIGAVIGGANEYLNGGDLGDIVIGAAAGGLSGLYGGFAGSALKVGSKLGATVGTGGAVATGVWPTVVEKH